MRFSVWSLVSLVLVLPVHADDKTKQEVFFESYVRPLLVQRCIECHSHATEVSGGLSLDSRDDWLEGGDSGSPIDLVNWEQSLLWKAVSYRDSHLQMPPNGKLNAKEIQVLQTWLETGAFDPRKASDRSKRKAQGLPIDEAQSHWAYRQINPPIQIPINHATTQIDAFLTAQQRSINVKPSPIASQAVLKQRLYLDLTGLRPYRRFGEQSNVELPAEAYDNIVDELLASPQFGEHFARHWMDIVRYAESITLRGFVLPEAWRYRDYLIDSFNGDKPFNQFVREQVAGDLMHSDRLDERQQQWIATTMLALGDTNLEEQDKKQLEMDYIDEQLDVIGKALLAQTLGCARCHDHKFDPIPTKDYYALAGILKSSVALEHSNVSSWVRMPLPLDPETELEYAQAEKKAVSLKTDLNRWKNILSSMNPNNRVRTLTQLPGIVVDDSRANKKGNWQKSTFSPVYVEEGYLHDQNNRNELHTVTFIPDELPPGRYVVRISYASGANRASNTLVRVFSADGEDVHRVNQKLKPKDDGMWLTLGEYLYEQGGRAEVEISNDGADGHVIADAVQFLPAGEGRNSESKEDESKSESEVKKIIADLEKELSQATRIASSRPMVITLRASPTPKNLSIHIRGSVHQLGEEVPRGFLRCVSDCGQAVSAQSNGRLELAEWLTSAKQPLTARVYVNRVWAHLMKEGIVRTVDNFGTTGESPSNPELLDWLTQQFIDHGWSTKWLVREIVTSDAYKRSSFVEPSQALNDPENRTFARSPIRRVLPESMRDILLQAGGDLDLRRKPEGNFPISLKEDYRYEHNSRMRTVYGPWFRNSLPELYREFDGPNPSFSIGQRSQSTIAPQALLFMNSPFVDTRCRQIAKRLVPGTTAANLEFRICQLYENLIGRHPTPEEQMMAMELLGEPSDTTFAILAKHLVASLDFRYSE